MPKSTCSFIPCGRAVYAKEWCAAHYQQQRKGKELKPITATHRGLPEADRFRARVHKTGDCWTWRGATINGYGSFTADGKRTVLAHRYAWELANGPIPDGMHVDHVCFERKCVRPDHLRLATQKQNNEYKQGAQRNSKSGVRGVSWHKARKKWVTWVGDTYCGIYDDLAEAEAVVKAKRAETFTFPEPN